MQIPGPTSFRHLGRLKVEADRLLALSIAPNSHKAYNSAWKAYEKMRNEINKSADLPVARADLLEFIAYLSLTDRCASTIGSYVSGLGFLHKSNDMDDPADCFVVRKMLEGCRRDKPRKPDIRRPLTLTLLKCAVEGTQMICTSVYESCLFKAAMVLAFYGFLRVGEFTATSSRNLSDRVLQKSDISFSSKGHPKKPCVEITIRFSKTDQRGTSTTLIIQNQGITSHSFRIGACTHFAMAGISDDELMKLGRWSSNAYQRYIRIPQV